LLAVIIGRRGVSQWSQRRVNGSTRFLRRQCPGSLHARRWSRKSAATRSFVERSSFDPYRVSRRIVSPRPHADLWWRGSPACGRL